MATVSELETVLTADDSDLRRGLDSGDNQVGNFARNTNRRLGQLAMGFAGFALSATTAIGGAALAASISWEDSFADVRKTVGDLTDEELADLEIQLREMATTGVTGSLEDAHSQLAAIAALGGQLGVAGDDLDEFTQTVAAFGVAAESVPTEQAALFFAQFANLTGLDIGEDVDNIADAVVHLGNNLSTTEPMIINFGERMGSLANVGFEADEILGWGAAMASLGLSAELGSTNFALSIADMQRATREGGDDLATWAETAGMAADEFAELANSDPSAAFDAFVEGLGQMESSDAQATLDALNITGTEQRRVIMSLAGSYDTVTQALDLAEEGFAGNNAAMTEAEAKADTTGGKLALLKNNVIDLAIALGDELSPGFNRVLDGLIALTEGDITGINDIALGITDMAESVGELFGLGGEDGELEWVERLEAGIIVFGDLQDAMSGMGPAAMALSIIFDNLGRDLEQFYLETQIQFDEWALGFRQAVLDATGGRVDIAPDLQVDTSELRSQLYDLQIADAITDAIREDLNAGAIDLSDEMIQMGGLDFSLAQAIELDAVDAEDFGVEGRAALESALLMAFEQGDEEAQNLLLPLAAELDFDIESIASQAQENVVGTVEGEAYDAVATVDITLMPGQIDASAVDLAIAATTANSQNNSRGGGDNYVVNSYGQNAYDLVNTVQTAARDSGANGG